MDDADPGGRGSRRGAGLHTPHPSSVGEGGVSDQEEEEEGDAMVDEEGEEGVLSMEDGGGLHRLFSMVMAGLVRSPSA